MTRKRKPSAAPPTTPKPAYPKVIETYREISGFDLDQMTTAHPSVGNGQVSIRRYRVTVELIEEPVDVLADRLRALARSTTNHHHRDPMRREAYRLGVMLDERQWGADVKKG